jgi:hypothetical protein
VERTERHLRTLRRFTEISLNMAEALEQQAQALAAQAQAQAAQAQDTKEAAGAVERIGGELSLALYRLARLARLNMALEEKLVEAHRARGREVTAERGRQAKAAEDASLEQQKSQVVRAVWDAAKTDDGLDKVEIESLVRDLHERLDGGAFDEDLLRHPYMEIVADILLDRGVAPDWERLRAAAAAEVAREAAIEAARGTDGPPPEGSPVLRGTGPENTGAPHAAEQGEAASEPPRARTGTDPP